LSRTSITFAARLSMTLALTRLWDWLEREQSIAVRHHGLGLTLLAFTVLVR
jgi:hypothetical protein